ncbi:MAG: glutamate--tRNA ligase [Prevotella sp.]|nr:glutamate--tRNA ligase [Prevotella sp.]MDY5666703.1 glutamate--tRNA ligase [Alloprevotella sp.]
MSERTVRVRFAPSPTGPLHIGGVRTALYNYLFARQHGGKIIFRIEDTDSNRFVPGAEDYIIESFKWLGIEFDEGVSFGGDFGPYRQSERRDIYRQYVKQLLDAGKAYIAFDTPEELTAKREAVQNFQYDAHTRGEMRNSLVLGEAETQRLIEAGEQYVVRFKVEPGEEVHVNDIIRGDVRIMSDILDDKVLYKSADDLPTYHLANIVDDHLMQITHVIRGEEWLPSAPLHVLLYRAFGWADTMPQFAHLPLLLKPDGKGKLSKRDGDRLGFPVFPLEWHDPKTGDVSSGYRESGYLPQAVINFLALLGWNPGTDQEILSMQELIDQFDLSKCSKSGAKFDYIKGQWFNREYIINTPDAELAPAFDKILKANGIDQPIERVEAVVGMMKMKKINFIHELWPLCDFFFIAPTYSKDDKFTRKNWKENTAAEMTELLHLLEGLDDFSIESQKAAVDAWAASTGVKPWNPWRVALVGTGKGPDMYELAAFLGKDETLRRMHAALEALA